MALVTTLSVPVIDDAGKIKRVPVHFPATVTLAQIQAYSDTFAVAIDDVVGGILSAPTVTFQLTLPGGLDVAVTADHFNRQGALLNFGAANTNYSHSVYVPSWLDTGIAAGEITVAGSPWADFITLLSTGDGTIAPTDKQGNDLEALQSAALSFRK